MAEKYVYSICGMCTARCPIMVEVREGRVHHIWGNPHSSLGGTNLCPRGAAGKVFEYDDERPQYPLLRDGERGSGNWKRIGWDEALDRVADKLMEVREKHGPQAWVLSDRGGPHREFHRTLHNAYGSPNYFNHHATCSNSVHNGHVSVSGLPRNGVVYDYKNCRHLLAFGRNFLEAILTGEAKNIIDLLDRGDKFTFIDVRWNYTAAKATRFHMIRPTTDLFVAQAILHVLIKEHLYDTEFVANWVTGLDELAEMVRPMTPEVAEEASGMPADAIRELARDLAEKAPQVIVYPGYMTAWSEQDFYLRRSLYAINALLGTYEAKGGLIIAKGPGDAGVKLRQLTSQVGGAKGERFDGIGTTVHHLGKGWGLGQKLPEVIQSGDPYPVKVYTAMRHDPVASLPDPDAFKQGLAALEMLVSIDVNWSETGWFADLILPEATFLERTDNVVARKGPKPKLALRRQAVEPRFDAKPRWWIFKELAKRMGYEEYYPYETIEEEIAWQLEGTGISLSDFDATGEVALTDQAIMQDRRDGLKFKTPSGKIELTSSVLETNGLPSWIKPQAPEKLTGNRFRMITGKVAVHTQGRTTANNELLHEIVSENKVHISSARAAELGLKDGQEVLLKRNGISQRGILRITEFVHDDVAFMLHGFGDTVPLRTRSHGKGIADMKLAKGQLQVAVGGNCPLTDTCLTIEPVASTR